MEYPAREFKERNDQE